MEAVERRTELGEKFKSHIRLGLGGSHGVGHMLPRAHKGVATKGVQAVPAEAVPIAHGKAQVLFHALAKNQSVPVVPFEGQGVGGRGALINNGCNVGEVRSHKNTFWKLKNRSQFNIDAKPPSRATPGEVFPPELQGQEVGWK
jgi:hypothetical protein